MSSDVYYFGDARLQRGGPGAGHHLWRPHPAMAGLAWALAADEKRLPWSLAELDGRLAGDPALEDPRRPGHWATEHQPEGVVRLHHRDGWTAIALWDRSADERGGANSVFVARGTLTAREMAEVAQAAFPAIWRRITRRVALTLPPEAPRPEPAPEATTGPRIEAPRLMVVAAGESFEIPAEEVEEALGRGVLRRVGGVSG